MAEVRSGRLDRPDLVYLVHEADNEPLRYSLRSVARNCRGMYRRIWVAGVRPGWVQHIGHVPVERHGEKFSDIRAKVAAIADDDRLTREVVIMNDDYFAMDPIVSWEPYHLGPTSEYLARLAAKGTTPRSNTWARAIRNTAEWMADQGHGDILCYEGHVPLAFDRHRLSVTLAAYPEDRSCDYPGFYPIAGAGGTGRRAGNAKVGSTSGATLRKRLAELDIPWLSSNDDAFSEGALGGYIRGAFRTPSPYERG